MRKTRCFEKYKALGLGLSKTTNLVLTYLQHFNIEGPSFNMQGLEYLSGSISFNELKKVHIYDVSMVTLHFSL